MIFHSLFQPYDLLIQHHKFLLHHHVLVVVSEEPILKLQPLVDHVQEVVQAVRRIIGVQPSDDPRRGAGDEAPGD